MTCCNLAILVLLWWKSGRVTETMNNGTQTLEEDRCSQDALAKIMLAKHGKAAHCRSDCPFLLKCHAIQSQSWHFHCDPNDAFGKARSEAAHRVMRTSFDPQSVLETFPVPQILVPQLYTRLPCCTHPDDESLSQRDTCDRSMSKGSDGRQRLFSYPCGLVSFVRQCRSLWNLAGSESSSLIS